MLVLGISNGIDGNGRKEKQENVEEVNQDERVRGWAHPRTLTSMRSKYLVDWHY